MFDIQRDANNTSDTFYDIWILTEGLPTHDLEKMNQMQLGETCCYDADLINGYARIVKKTANSTIFEYREGHFTKGVQDNFGRFLKIDDTGKVRSYTGWWPSGSMGGQGMATYAEDGDFNANTTMIQGEFKAMSDGFPETNFNAKNLEEAINMEYVVDSLKRRIDYLKQ